MRKIRISMILAMVAFMIQASFSLSVEDLFEKIRAVNGQVTDYSAAVDVQVNAQIAFVPYNPRVLGRYFYKRPDKHKLEVEEAPSYLKKYPNIFGYSLPDLKKYRGVVVEGGSFNGRPVYRVELLPRGGSSVSRIDLLVDKERSLVLRNQTTYKNQGSLDVQVQYKKDSSYWVFDTMKARFVFPSVKVNATASAKYSDYRYNQGLPDSFFEKD